MSTHIKAIETRYNGYLFRSRLEARWAVFFDHAGIPFRYEAEGFDVRGRWYLPDFWLPEHDVFVEIKPTWPGELRAAMLILGLARGTGNDASIFMGNCYPGEFRMLTAHGSGRKSRLLRPPPGDLDHSGLMRCRRCDGLCYTHWEGGRLFAWGEIGKHTCGDHDRYPVEFPRPAWDAARSARFD